VVRGRVETTGQERSASSMRRARLSVVGMGIVYPNRGGLGLKKKGKEAISDSGQTHCDFSTPFT